MREIKFRAWHKNMGLMVFCVSVTRDGWNIPSGELWRHGHEYLMQFTGLSDKSGKEIYEGDIVRQARCRCDDCARFGEYRIFSIGEFDYLNGNTRIARSESIEVIGNIYENGNLLEVKP